MDDPENVFSHRRQNLEKKLKEKEYRDGYVEALNRRFLALQMSRFQGEKSLQSFADRLKMRSFRVKALKAPECDKWTLKDLFHIAHQLDVAVVIRFVSFSDFLDMTEFSAEKLCPPAYRPPDE